MECLNCKGTGQIPDPNTFRIPLWSGWEARGTVSFVALDREKDNDEVREIGKAFAKFIKAQAHGCFSDGLKAELNRD